MRQGQQHRRGRTRGGQNNNHTVGNNNNNNRKGQNPISRTYQSNGPDGKVSGTASGIAEKYLSMARDATTSGDPVLAENYLQHAEHYNRIILAYRETQAIQNGNEGAVQHQRNGADSDNADDQGEDEGETYGRDMQPLPPMEIAQRPQPDPQPPRAFDQPRDQREGQAIRPDRDGGQNRSDNQRFDERQPRFNDSQQRRHNNQPNQNQPRDRDDRFPRERYPAERFNNGDRQNGGNERFNGPNGQNGPNNQPRTERFQNDRPRNDRPQYGDRQQRTNERGSNDRSPNERNDERPARDTQPRPDFIRPDVTAEGRSETRVEQQRPERFEQPRPSFQPRETSREVHKETVRPDAAFAETPSPELPLKSDQAIIAREPTVRAPRPPRRAAVPTVVAEHEQPEFLRRPVRRPRKEVVDEASPAVAPPEDAVTSAAAPSPVPDREPPQE